MEEDLRYPIGELKQILPISLLIMAAATLAINTYDGPNKTDRPLAQKVDRYSDGGSGSMEMLTTNAGMPKDNENALIQMEQQWNEALKTHNANWFEKNLADDFTDISSGNGALSTKAEDIANLKVDKTVYQSLELSNLKPRVAGNAGVVTGVNHIKGHDEHGQSFDVRLGFTDTYIKRHGRWQAWASQHTRIRP